VSDLQFVIAIDTSSPNFSLCAAPIINDEQVNIGSVVLRISDDHYCHEDELSRGIKELLDSFGASVSQVREIRLARGPGSFTGLRLGYAFVRGFIYGTPIRVVEIDLLEAIAAQAIEPVNYIPSIASPTVTKVLVISDARRGELFTVRAFVPLESDKQLDTSEQLDSNVDKLSVLSEPTILSSTIYSLSEFVSLVELSRFGLVGDLNSSPYLIIAKDLPSYELITASIGSNKNAVVQKYFGSALNLLHPICSQPGRKIGINEYCEFSPNYIRQVAAKKIVDRL
jgi:tRNA threonylcarbamoyl adenosine modification protein YeaZ